MRAAWLPLAGVRRQVPWAATGGASMAAMVSARSTRCRAWAMRLNLVARDGAELVGDQVRPARHMPIASPSIDTRLHVRGRSLAVAGQDAADGNVNVVTRLDERAGAHSTVWHYSGPERLGTFLLGPRCLS